MNSSTKTIIFFIIRIVLGITFIYSSFHKIEDPAGFAKILYGYAVFPDASINLLAIMVPFVELTTGLCLVFNLMPCGALLTANVLLALFIALIGFNLIRGHEFDCGCFTSVKHINPMLSNIFSIIRDTVLLCAGLFYWRDIRAS